MDSNFWIERSFVLNQSFSKGADLDSMLLLLTPQKPFSADC